MTASLLGPSAPSLDEPIEMLDACHGRITAQIDTLRRLIGHLAASGPDSASRQAAAAVIRYFEVAAPHHHADEEEDLFPALQAAAKGEDRTIVEALVVRLLDDHRRMDRVRDRLLSALHPVSAGAGDLDARLVDALAALYLAHIAVETEELFPLARRLLATETLNEIGRRMAARRGVPRSH